MVLENSVDTVSVEMAYADPTHQVQKQLDVAVGSTVLQVIQASGLLEHLPDVEVLPGRVGIFGTVVALDTVVQAGDRVEVYRCLPLDPKEARYLRAKQHSLKRTPHKNKQKSK